jgi:preprotein translocase subunit SecG
VCVCVCVCVCLCVCVWVWVCVGVGVGDVDNGSGSASQSRLNQPRKARVLKTSQQLFVITFFVTCFLKIGILFTKHSQDELL